MAAVTLDRLANRLGIEAMKHAGEYQQCAWLTPVEDACEPGRILGLRLAPLGVERRFRSRAALILLLAELLDDGADVSPLPSAPDVEVAPVVDQLVGSLSTAPASPPVHRAALVAA